MTPERWQQIDRLLEAALERAPEERAGFLNEVCAGDEALRREVESLLAADERAGSFIEAPPAEAAAEMLRNGQTRLAEGQLVGHYTILSLLGAGGMGEVYRARDNRLGREVAVKALPSAFSTDADRLRRFEQEARAVGMLNHPNILTVHDAGAHEGMPYIVSELLEGDTLRDRLNDSPLPQRKAIDYALQIARGLAIAHEKGIVHRDLKPENLFITKDSRVKILDFGLAKLIQPKLSVAAADAPTLSPKTDPGAVMGTVGYMSPEQVRGQEADHRSDIFAFGVILYEMLSGKRAFQGESAVETLNAILKEEPAELSETNRNISPALERVVKHCLEKSPEERFQSARDLAFDLEALPSISGRSAASTALRPARSNLLRLLFAASLLAAVALAAFFAGERTGEKSPPSFRRLTFRRGFIDAARFTPDGRTIIYSAAWSGNPIRLFLTHPENPESRPFELPDAGILSISSSGEMAISLSRRNSGVFIFTGTLARVPLAGAAPREILEDVLWADWAPDGDRLAVVRDVGGKTRLEFPIGKVLYETSGWIGHPRISPNGELIAFLDHAIPGDDGGSVAVVDLAGNKRTLSSDWGSEKGVAWSPNGDEIWFTATKAGGNHALYAVTLSGKERLIMLMAGGLTLNDISRDGRVLITRDNERYEIICLPPGETKERDLSWHDWSVLRDLSDDGKLILFEEAGEGAGETYYPYLRKTDGSPPVRLSKGSARSLSPDGKWALLSFSISDPPQQLFMLPTGAGESKQLTNDEIQHDRASWFPDGKRFLFQGAEPGRGKRLYVQDIEMGTPRAVTPEGVTFWGEPVSPDGKFVVGIDLEQKVSIYPVDGGESRSVSGLSAGDLPLRWSADGRALYVFRRGELPAKVYRVDLSTGRKEFWKEFMPSDPAGVKYIPSITLTPDGKSYAYSYYRTLSDLYLVEGLK